MTARALSLCAVLLAGCTVPTATEPAPNETVTMETSPPPAESPQPAPPETVVGRLEPMTHRYSNGCVDHREVEILALVVDERPTAVLLGWRRASPRHNGEPHFLRQKDELSESARKSKCVAVTGTVVTYAHQGYSGHPAKGLEATRIEPAPCPP